MSSIAADLSETTESGTKRIFRKMYTISMLAEVPQDRIVDSYGYKVLRVLIPVTDRDWFDRYHEEILDNQASPLGHFTQQEREMHGRVLPRLA